MARPRLPMKERPREHSRVLLLLRHLIPARVQVEFLPAGDPEQETRQLEETIRIQPSPSRPYRGIRLPTARCPTSAARQIYGSFFLTPAPTIILRSALLPRVVSRCSYRSNRVRAALATSVDGSAGLSR